MQPIILKTFKGCAPRLSAKLLPEGFAQTATNCDLRRGRLEAFLGMTSVVASYGSVPTVFTDVRSVIKIDRDGTATTAMTWLASKLQAGATTPPSFVRAQIANSGDRIYATGVYGQTKPVQTNMTLWGTGAWRDLGVVAPTTALTTTPQGTIEYDEKTIATFTNCAIEDGPTPLITVPSEQSISGYSFELGDIVTISGATNTDDNGKYRLKSWSVSTNALVVDEAFEEGQLTGITVVVSRLLDAQVVDSVSYVYTRVITWADGSEEESAPSEPTAVLDVYSGQYYVLSGFAAGGYSGDSPTRVLSYRVYRLAAGTSGAEYQFLGDVPYVAGSETFTDDAWAATGDDHGLLDVQDDILETTDWEPPPAGLCGLIQYSNGILAGFVGNKLYLSEPWVGYAWPSGYTMTFDYDIVALAVHNECIYVLTTGFPYIVTGLDPTSMTQQILPYEQSCVSAQGVVATNVGVVYPTPDGLFLLSGNSGKLLTKDVYTKEQWQALTPSTLISFFYDDQYFGFFRSTRYGVCFNFKENPYIVSIDLGAGASITAGYLDPLDDKLYIVNGSALYSWGTNATSLNYTWKSAIYRPGDAANYSCAAVVADTPSAGISATFQFYADSSAKLATAKTISSDEAFRLPGGYRARDFEFLIAGNLGIDSVAIGQSPLELM